VSTTADVLAAARDLVSAYGRHDAARYFAGFAPDATFIFYTTPARLTSRAAYEQLWARWEREEAFRVLSCESEHQAVQDLGAAAIFSHDRTASVRRRGAEQTTWERETIVFAREQDRWLAVHAHLSPQPEPTVVPEPA
jgi:ketosteroid isomerase-like protein